MGFVLIVFIFAVLILAGFFSDLRVD